MLFICRISCNHLFALLVHLLLVFILTRPLTKLLLLPLQNNWIVQKYLLSSRWPPWRLKPHRSHLPARTLRGVRPLVQLRAPPLRRPAALLLCLYPPKPITPFPMPLRTSVTRLVKRVVGALLMNTSSKGSVGCVSLKALKLVSSEFNGRATHRTKTRGRFSPD